MSLLEIKNLSLSIMDTQILRDVSLTVNAGEIVSITGESGSGKSMTALASIGLLPQGSKAKGFISLQGRDLLNTSEAGMCKLRGKDIGMVFQEPMTALNPVQTIGAQVAETILLHTDASKAEAMSRAAGVLARVGLPQDRFPLSRYPHELSGGQRQRVVIAMAIALRPKLLIADEPTTALDVTTQSKILVLLQDLAREYTMGLLMITHDLAVVAQMADKIIVMRKGEIVEQGKTQSLLENMQHEYTKMLFAASKHEVDLPEIHSRETLLKVDNIVREYKIPRKNIFKPAGRFRALDHVSLNIAQGERVGLVGESGCGKSTLTRAILGLDAVQSGQITLDDTPVYNAGKPDLNVRRKMQVVFQDPFGSFNPRQKVAQLITEPFHLLEEKPDQPAQSRLIARTLTAVGLSPADADKYIHQFSGGQRQRIAIARALIIEPELIVFDEAVSALDVSVRAQILDLLAELSTRYQLSYLFISHDLNVVRTITDRVLVMQDGKIVEEGRTAQVLNAPQHAYTQELIAAAPVLPDPDADKNHNIA